MRSLVLARTILTLTLVIGGASAALAGGWWCEGYCLGPPYGNYDPPAKYVYDHRVGPTWTGNGWAYLPVGTYYPVPPGAVVVPRARYDADVEVYREPYATPRRHRPMK